MSLSYFVKQFFNLNCKSKTVLGYKFVSFLSKHITGTMIYKATCNQFAVCFSKGSFNR